MNIFIANAYAQAGQPPQGGGLELVFMLVVFGLIFYFMLYRPQAKRMKEHKALLAALSKNDEVLTQGGLVGKLTKVSADKDFVVMAIADGTEVVIQKAAITAVLPKGTMKSL